MLVGNVNASVVPVEDCEALSEALLHVIHGGVEVLKMATVGQRRVGDYALPNIVKKWSVLFSPCT